MCDRYRWAVDGGGVPHGFQRPSGVFSVWPVAVCAPILDDKKKMSRSEATKQNY
jgi:hypothetical protein